ncbi:MAG TPA: TatD family hydrolase [Candidatus Omnitrophota bacterium]|nr:TatD family hydrolase [Candidatus Omnitrophota bacterium]
MLIDTHCHLDFPDYDQDRDVVVKTAIESGVEAIINVASSFEASKNTVHLSEIYPQVYASIGIHPHDSKDCKDEYWPHLERLLKEEKVVAVGEVGLDFYRNLSDPQIQEKIFRRFIDMACVSGKPLIIHSRLASERTIAILKDYEKIKIGGVVIHCFSGDMDFLKTCLEMGFFVSFTCNVTYKKADAIRQALAYVPIDRMFLETDAPFLSPEGKRGRRNEPANLLDLVKEVSRVKNMDFEKVCSETTKNARKFFHI